MTFQQKDLTGSLFKNTRKTADTHADYNGTATVDGREFYLDAWIKEGAKGKYMSLRLKPKDHDKATSRTADRDIPF
jgi:hypothetical protein